MILLENIIHRIFADNIREFISAQKPSHGELKVLNHIVSCRTPALGAAVYECSCGERSFAYHSCRDRHCPVCQASGNARWAEKQMACSLPVEYFHVVFTLPDTLNGFVRSHPRQAYNALFEAASSALLKLCANRKYLGAMPGFTAVLHTWGQTMLFHPHLHVIVTAGGLSEDGARFVDKSGSGFLVPVRVLSRLFRGIFIDALDKRAPLPPDLKRSLYQTDFFCHLKEPLGRPDNVVKYLARYANRVCISASRVVSYDNAAKTVTFSYKDNKDGGKQKEMTISAIEFIRRFSLHVLPRRFMKIRHYGILQNRGKLDRIAACRRLLDFLAKPSSTTARAAGPACPKCGRRLIVSEHLSALRLRLLPLLC